MAPTDASGCILAVDITRPNSKQTIPKTEVFMNDSVVTLWTAVAATQPRAPIHMRAKGNDKLVMQLTCLTKFLYRSQTPAHITTTSAVAPPPASHNWLCWHVQAAFSQLLLCLARCCDCSQTQPSRLSVAATPTTLGTQPARPIELRTGTTMQVSKQLSATHTTTPPPCPDTEQTPLLLPPKHTPIPRLSPTPLQCT